MRTRVTPGDVTRRASHHLALACAALLGTLLAPGCATTQRPPVVIATPAPTVGEPAPTPIEVPTPPILPPPPVESREVTRVPDDIVVSVWTEPRRLPAGGGQAQVIVRVLKRSGRPLPGVEVRITSSAGALFSQGKILTTDARGMVRDSLATSRPTTVTVSAGGREQRVEVLLGEAVLDD